MLGESGVALGECGGYGSGLGWNCAKGGKGKRMEAGGAGGGDVIYCKGVAVILIMSMKINEKERWWKDTSCDND